MESQPIIFDYLDYRAYLTDMFGFRKAQKRYFSYRFFARKSGFKSPNFLKLVQEGQRNLTPDSIAKIAKGFDLKKQEREYFEYLVFMNQAASHDEKNRYYQRMISVKGCGEIRRIEKASYEYFSKWYYPVVREILNFGPRALTAAQIAPLLKPPITAAEAEKALKFLVDQGLIQKDADGRWVQTDQNLTTGPEVRSLVVANFHREMIRLAAESIERFPANQRDVTGLVLCVRQDQMAEIKERTARFRKELLRMATETAIPDQVVQVNIQVFPLTGRYEEEQG